LRLRHYPYARERCCSLARRWLDYTNALFILVTESGGEPALQRVISLLVSRNVVCANPFIH